ncbi:type IV secretion system protein VirB10 [Sphingomonas daechungensis]|uniref:Type VI secretion protein n=1 Tax=Sphingomonas daechungensis TaxID=1176646 RepID=A0ABX6T040_9SPHN|nr:TrbI/VirB10 family protein [Sphingomonas daechungensis]QNP43207.1 type VI secretion protein [Sphingomonas daechungensis]
MNNSLVLLEKQQQSDPRIELEPETLALAKRNAFPLVAQRSSKKDGMGMAVGVGGVLLLGVATFATMSGSREVQPAKPPQAASLPQTAKPGGIVVPADALTPVPAIAPGAAPTDVPGITGVPPVGATGQILPPAEAVNPHGGPALIVDTSSNPSSATASPLDPFGASSGDVAKATRMKNPGQTVSQGTLIPAVLETAINSDLPGYVRAVVSSDVRSFDGSRVLVPRSSRLIGQYKSGVANGQTRAYVMWTRVIRPDGVSVALGSPAVDAAGQTGLTGTVDTHFMKRFGSALLLSIVGAASTVGTGGSALLVSGGQSAASVAAQQNGTIPPTIKVRQGQPIRVFTAKDLDFSTVAG